MKMKEFGPPGGGARVPGAPPLDPPLHGIKSMSCNGGFLSLLVSFFVVVSYFGTLIVIYEEKRAKVRIQ